MRLRNVSFRWRRFWLLLCLQWRDQLLWPYFIPLFAVFWAWVIMVRPSNMDSIHPSVVTQNSVSVFSLWTMLSSSLYAGHLFWEFRNSARARQWLQLPASVQEKWLSKLSFGIFAFPLYAMGVVWLCVYAIQVYVLHQYAFRYETVTLGSIADMLPGLFSSILLAMAAGQYWRNYGYWVLALSFVALYFCAVNLSYWFSPGGIMGTEALPSALEKHLPMPDWVHWGVALFKVLGYGTTIGLLIGSYLTFRETEA